MAEVILFSVFESGFSIDLSALCDSNEIQQTRIQQTSFSTNRKLIAQLKKTEPDYIIAEFIYSPSLGTQISNLDGLLGSVERYCQKTQLIIYTESRYREMLESIRKKFTLHHVLEYPVKQSALCSIIK